MSSRVGFHGCRTPQKYATSEHRPDTLAWLCASQDLSKPRTHQRSRRGLCAWRRTQRRAYRPLAIAVLD
jgi:hypothetical protein